MRGVVAYTQVDMARLLLNMYTHVLDQSVQVTTEPRYRNRLRQHIAEVAGQQALCTWQRDGDCEHQFSLRWQEGTTTCGELKTQIQRHCNCFSLAGRFIPLSGVRLADSARLSPPSGAWLNGSRLGWLILQSVAKTKHPNKPKAGKNNNAKSN